MKVTGASELAEVAVSDLVIGCRKCAICQRFYTAWLTCHEARAPLDGMCSECKTDQKHVADRVPGYPFPVGS